jgi:hypothetical protein
MLNSALADNTDLLETVNNLIVKKYGQYPIFRLRMSFRNLPPSASPLFREDFTLGDSEITELLIMDEKEAGFLPNRWDDVDKVLNMYRRLMTNAKEKYSDYTGILSCQVQSRPFGAEDSNDSLWSDNFIDEIPLVKELRKQNEEKKLDV